MFAVKKATPPDNYQLLLQFKNGGKKIFVVKPYLGKGIFKDLNNRKIFNTARVSFDTVE